MAGVVFTEKAGDRIADTVRWVEGERGRRPGGLVGGGLEPTFVRVTSSTADGDGNYPGTITVRSPDGDWQDYSDVKVKPLNGESLTSGTRYGCRGVGFAPGGEELYVPLAGTATAAAGGWDTIIADGPYDPDDVYGYWKGEKWVAGTGYVSVILYNPNSASDFEETRQTLNAGLAHYGAAGGISYLAVKVGTKTFEGDPVTYDLYHVDQQWNGMRFCVQNTWYHWPDIQTKWQPETPWLTLDFLSGLHLTPHEISGNYGPVLKIMPAGIGYHNEFDIYKWVQGGSLSSGHQFVNGAKGTSAWVGLQNWNPVAENAGLFICAPNLEAGPVALNDLPPMGCTCMFGDGTDAGSPYGNGAVMAHGILGDTVPVNLTNKSYTAIKAKYSGGTSGAVIFRTEAEGAYHPPDIVIGTDIGATGEIRNDDIGLLLTFQSGLLVSGTSGSGTTYDFGVW